MRFHFHFTLSLVSLFPTLLSAHGIITQPPSRKAGTDMKAVCGEQVTNNLQSNKYGDIQQLLQIGAQQNDFSSACDVSLCKGLQFANNNATVQAFAPGQVVPITVDIQAKHTGVANVSVVGTRTNAIMGDMLIAFPVYASTSTDLPKNQTQFNITMPDFATSCAAPGDYVVQ